MTKKISILFMIKNYFSAYMLLCQKLIFEANQVRILSRKTKQLNEKRFQFKSNS